MKKFIAVLMLCAASFCSVNAGEINWGEKLAFYLPNRLLDALDTFSVNLGVGPVAQARVMVTRYCDIGAGISAKATGCDDNIIKYLGITLLPQAGVALGMANMAMALSDGGETVRNITLFAVLIYEIVGPFLTKIALTKAGDIKTEGRVSARDAHLAQKAEESAK